jgi:hypothetical protein
MGTRFVRTHGYQFVFIGTHGRRTEHLCVPISLRKKAILVNNSTDKLLYDRTVTAGPDMKASQAYPVKFGFSVAYAFHMHRLAALADPLPVVVMMSSDDQELLRTVVV